MFGGIYTFVWLLVMVVLLIFHASRDKKLRTVAERWIEHVIWFHPVGWLMKLGDFARGRIL